MKNKLVFKLFPEKYCYAHFKDLPEELHSTNFFSLTKTPTEFSLFCEQRLVNDSTKHDKNWRVLQLQGIFDLESDNSVGITSRFSTVLAKYSINLCVIATFDTDYLLIKELNLELAMQHLRANNFEIVKRIKLAVKLFINSLLIINKCPT